MTKEELDAFLASEEVRRGLMTGELRSIWKQESGGSLDPTLKGQPLSKGRGSAVGPFQVVPYYHPEFPANGTLAEQAQFASELYAKGGKTPEDRMASYYGRGVAPKGHPTTAQYQQQVMSRIPQYQNAAPTPQEQTMADPYTLLNAASPDSEEERKRREMMAYVQQQAAQRQASMPRYSDYADEPMPQRELTTFEKMMSNPLTQLGAAMMVGSGVDWGRAGGMGLIAANNAVYNRQQAENELWELQQKRREAQQKNRRENRKMDMEDMTYEETQRLADMYEAKGDPITAAQIRVGGSKMVSPTTAGMSPRIWTDGKKTFERIYKSDGSFIDRDMGTAKPATLDPTLQGTIAENKAAGTEIGKATAQSEINAPQDIAKADAAITTIDKMLAHPGLEKAVGWASVAPTFPESDAADYETMFKQMEGQNFLQAFRDLKGGGQITEIEGQKATQALAPISLKQDAKAHRAALEYARNLAVLAKQRAQQGYGPKNPYRGADYLGGPVSSPSAQQTAPAAPSGVKRWNIEKGGWE